MHERSAVFIRPVPRVTDINMYNRTKKQINKTIGAKGKEGQENVVKGVGAHDAVEKAGQAGCRCSGWRGRSSGWWARRAGRTWAAGEGSAGEATGTLRFPAQAPGHSGAEPGLRRGPWVHLGLWGLTLAPHILMVWVVLELHRWVWTGDAHSELLVIEVMREGTRSRGGECKVREEGRGWRPTLNSCTP